MNGAADVPVLDTNRMESSTHIDNKSIRTLPDNSRNYREFVKLTPGATIVQGPDG